MDKPKRHNGATPGFADWPVLAEHVPARGLEVIIPREVTRAVIASHDQPQVHRTDGGATVVGASPIASLLASFRELEEVDRAAARARRYVHDAVRREDKAHMFRWACALAMLTHRAKVLGEQLAAIFPPAGVIEVAHAVAEREAEANNSTVELRPQDLGGNDDG